jgi:hypothetical protein
VAGREAANTSSWLPEWEFNFKELRDQSGEIERAIEILDFNRDALSGKDMGDGEYSAVTVCRSGGILLDSFAPPTQKLLECAGRHTRPVTRF